VVSRDPEEPTVVVFTESPYHLRPFDFNRGDRRTFTHEEALEIARLRVKDRGCRQQVRKVRTQPGDVLTPVWLIQDI